MSAYPDAPVLVVDDDQEALQGYELLLLSMGIDNVVALADPRRALPWLSNGQAAIMILDLAMPQLSGEEVLREVREHHPQLPVVVVTAVADTATAVRCMKGGAYDFFLKPVDDELFRLTVRRAIEHRQLHQEISELRAGVLDNGLRNPEAFASMLTRNPRMLALMRYLEAVAPSPEPVLVSGESGTGKELAAQALHTLSGSSGELVAVNVAGLDDTLFSDALFGHRRGAFTGAEKSREGMIEQAAGGTLLLDEIGELSQQSQVKLLRLLQEREYYPLGADTPRRSSARIVVATNLHLQRAVDEGGFRRDLFYRLQTHHVALPPLRERLADLPVLAAHFVAEAAAAMGKPAPAIGDEVLQLLATHHYPGNVRELRGILFDAVSLAAGAALPVEPIQARLGGAGAAAPDTLAARSRATPALGSGAATAAAALGAGAVPAPAPAPTRQAPGAGATEPGRGEDASAAELRFGATLPTLRIATEQLIDEALQRSAGNQTRAAALLGITHQALNQRLRRRARGSDTGTDT